MLGKSLTLYLFVCLVSGQLLMICETFCVVNLLHILSVSFYFYAIKKYLILLKYSFFIYIYAISQLHVLINLPIIVPPTVTQFQTNWPPI